MEELHLSFLLIHGYAELLGNAAPMVATSQCLATFQLQQVPLRTSAAGLWNPSPHTGSSLPPAAPSWRLSAGAMLREAVTGRQGCFLLSTSAQELLGGLVKVLCSEQLLTSSPLSFHSRLDLHHGFWWLCYTSHLPPGFLSPVYFPLGI